MRRRRKQMVLIHGFGLSAASWDPLLDLIGSTDCLDIRRVELPGHGTRSKEEPSGDPQAWTEGLDQILDQGPGDAVVVAFSFGTAVLGHRLTRAGTRGIGGCLLVGGIPGPETYTSDYTAIADAVAAGDPGADRSLVCLYAEQPAAQRRVAEDLSRVSPGARRAASKLPPVESGPISVPTSVIFGAADGIIIPPGVAKVQSVIANACYAEVPRAGHAVHLDNPAAVAVVLRELLTRLAVI